MEKTCIDYKLNELGPMGKKIKEIIMQEDAYIVYLDSDDVIQWYTYGYDKFDANFGEIQNKVAMWESISNNIFNSKLAYDMKSQLAEAYARYFDNPKNIKAARDIIALTSERVMIIGKEILKQVYIKASIISTLLILILLYVIKYYNLELILAYGQNYYDVIVTMLFGGIGAFIFTVLRVKTYKPNINVNKRIHVIDGMSRIFYGIIAGLIIAVAIKSNLLLGYMNNGNIYTFCIMGIVAGASDLFIPNIINHIGGKALENEK